VLWKPEIISNPQCSFAGFIISFVQIVIDILKCKYITKPQHSVMMKKLHVFTEFPAHTPVSLLQHNEPSANIQPVDLTTASVQKSPDIITSHNILNT
jgi:hypothetical protein